MQTQLDQGHKVIVFDAVKQIHLDLVAEIGLSSFPGIIFTGSTGLAKSVAELLKLDVPSVREDFTTAAQLDNILWLYGTASEKAIHQVDYLVTRTSCTKIVLEAEMLAKRMSKRLLFQMAADAADILKKESLIMQLSPKSVQGIGYATDDVLKGLTRLTLELLRIQKPGCLFLTGGDTADAVLHEAGVRYLRLEQELDCGIVKARCHGELLDQQLIVTKAGSFGSHDILLNIWQRLTSTERATVEK
ncbi:MAG TPA: hypothetical protein EYP18_06730 [Desulfobacterales bacterium]|nr:hypothetical protein [Desulfobacterales bacterium]